MKVPLEGQLLARWRQARDLSQEALGANLAKPLGPSSISTYERGASSATVGQLLNLISGLDVPGKTDAERLAAFFRGPELATAPWKPGPTQNVPVVDEPVAAGAARLSEHASAVIEFPISLLQLFLGEPPANEPDRYCLVDVHGDSMVPTIAHGARLLVDRGPGAHGWPEIDQGGIYVIVPPEADEDGGTTKRLFLTEQHLIVWADNPTFGARRWDRERLAHEDRTLISIARARVVGILTPTLANWAASKF